MAAKKVSKKKAIPARKASTVRVRNKHVSRTNNRKSLRRPLDFKPRPGVSASEALDTLVDLLRKAGLGADDSLFSLEDQLQEDLAEMREEPEQDLRAFMDEETPIVSFHFQLLDEGARRLAQVSGERTVVTTSKEVVSEDLEGAVAEVVRARNKLASRASACGIPLQFFDIRRAIKAGPAGLHARLGELLPRIEEQLDSFDSPRKAREFHAELVVAHNKLGALLRERTTNTTITREARVERSLTLQAVYALMLWMSGYGKSVFMDDPAALPRWRLDKMYKDGGKGPSMDDPIPAPTPAPAG